MTDNPREELDAALRRRKRRMRELQKGDADEPTDALAAEIDRLKAAQRDAATRLAAIRDRIASRKGTEWEGKMSGVDWFQFRSIINELNGEEE